VKTGANRVAARIGTQRGAALLMAMLTVTLVATFAAASLWQQWRGVEVEGTERARLQAAWVLVGALDWSRLILREDGRTGGTDNLNEPWALPLQEARLSDFLAADKNNTVSDVDAADAQQAFLSGQMVDAQSFLNATNLTQPGKSGKDAEAAFGRLFEQLGLPPGEVAMIARGMRAALAPDGGTSSAPLLPRHVAQMTWFGVSPGTLAAIDPYVTILPVITPVNVNTASATVLEAALGIDASSAERLVSARASRPFRNYPSDVAALTGPGVTLDPGAGAVASSYFEVRGRLRLSQATVEEHSLVRRAGIDVRTLWRERGALGIDASLAAAEAARR
jgi:general secretion pathway protein K